MPQPRTPRSHTRRPDARQRKKLSRKARQLIHHLIKVRRLSLRQAARALRLPNHGQLDQMLKGKIGETPAMKAAVLRADERARRARLNVPLDGDSLSLDLAVLKTLAVDLGAVWAALQDVIRRHDTPPP